MTVLTASPFNLAQGTLIRAKVAALNSKGTSSYSTVNSAGIYA